MDAHLHSNEVITMRDGIRQIATIGLGLVVVLGCGGGGGGTATAGTLPPGATPGTSVEPGTSEEPPASEEPSGGGGTAAGVCELVTADELAGIFSVASVTTTVLAGPPDNCIVTSDTGDPLTAWSLTTAQASVVYDSVTIGAIELPGIGDKAAIVQNMGLLVLKGGSLLVISISAGADLSDDEAIEASKQIATFAAGRM
jgi:hypothetical protein